MIINWIFIEIDDDKFWVSYVFMVVNFQHSIAAIKPRKSAARIFTSAEFALLGRLHRYPQNCLLFP
jgi:hypothetical protein